MIDEQHEPDVMLKGFQAVLSACTGLSPDAQLTVPLIAWLAIADGARNAALPKPGGYEAERARQLMYLEKIVQLIKSAQPNADVQRRRLVEGWTKALKQIKRLIETSKKTR